MKDLADFNDRLESLETICQRRHVRKLDVFGSVLNSEFNATSDLDFLVEFETLKPTDYATAFFGLLHDLEALFGRSVDLVESQAIQNPYFRDAVNQNRRTVYAA